MVDCMDAGAALVALQKERDALRAELESLRREAAAMVGLEVAWIEKCTHAAERSAICLSLEDAAALAKRVLLHAYRGSAELCRAAIRDAFATQAAEQRLLVGADLVAAPLADTLDVPLRTLNLLDRVGIQTVGELLALADVLYRLRIRGYGIAAARSLQAECRRLGERTAGAVLPPPPDVPLRTMPLCGSCGSEDGESGPSEAPKAGPMLRQRMPPRAGMALAVSVNQRWPVGAMLGCWSNNWRRVHRVQMCAPAEFQKGAVYARVKSAAAKVHKVHADRLCDDPQTITQGGTDHARTG